MHQDALIQTQILVEYADPLLAWLPIESTNLIKKYECTKLVSLGLILSPHPQIGEGSSTADKFQSFAPLIIHTPTFQFLLSFASWKQFGKNTFCTQPGLLCFEFIHTFSPRIHKIKIVGQRGHGTAYALGWPAVRGLD